MDAQRAVLHADLDAFFAAAEVRRRPELTGKPLIVGGRPGGRGVVSSASYEARRYGIRSGMPIGRAERLCPQAVFLPVDFAYYRELAAQFADLLLQVEGVEWTVVSGTADDEVHVSVRNVGHVRGAGEVVRQAFGELGRAGGHRAMAKAVVPLAQWPGREDIGAGVRERFLAALRSRGRA